MFLRLAVGSLLAAVAAAASAQPLSVLHIRVVLTDATRAPLPVPRHALLISDNPATSSPRRVVTGPDGTVDVRLRPGNYTIESDEAVAFQGKGYQWTQTVDLIAGRDLLLELTVANADVGAAPAASADDEPPNSDASLLLPRWRGSIVSVWTPTSRSSGFVVDAAGLVVTAERGVGAAATAEVQLTPALKVTGRVIAADRTKDVAVLRIDPALTATVPAVPLECTGTPKPPIVQNMKVVALGWPLHQPVDLAIGEVIRADGGAPIADARLAPGGIGGPVFNGAGAVVGLSSLVEDGDERRRLDTRLVPLADACQVMETARRAMPRAPSPSATPLPTEPALPFPSEALAAAARGGAADLRAYQMSSSEFDITFLSPITIGAARGTAAQAGPRGRTGAAVPDPARAGLDVTDFGDWTGYFADAPALVVVRVTPKLTESFWTTLARGAAYTQGVALPPIRHFKPGFSRLRAFCGDREVLPVHPFTLEQRVSETDAVREGLYVFGPDAFGPHCGSVTLRLSSEKAPGKDDTRTVDPKIVERVWQDFAAYRALAASGK
ncbi:MAG TPA: S1C family serine protease [Vicinamibacterales bacterium]|nr:S1C family serine protease [Vicinamibacterales bacterium]